MWRSKPESWPSRRSRLCCESRPAPRAGPPPAAASLRGPLEAPQLQAEAQLASLTLGATTMPTVQADLRYQAGVINLTSLRATQDDTTLSASGRIEPAGEISLDVG